jgi:hypothetical protein
MSFAGRDFACILSLAGSVFTCDVPEWAESFRDRQPVDHWL